MNVDAVGQIWVDGGTADCADCGGGIPNADIHRVPPEIEAIRELPGSGDNCKQCSGCGTFRKGHSANLAVPSTALHAGGPAAGLMGLPDSLQAVDEGSEAGGESFVAVVDPDVLADGG